MITDTYFLPPSGQEVYFCSREGGRGMTKSQISLKNRDILDLQGMTAAEMQLILDTAREMKTIIDRDIKKVPTLRG